MKQRRRDQEDGRAARPPALLRSGTPDLLTSCTRLVSLFLPFSCELATVARTQIGEPLDFDQQFLPAHARQDGLDP